MVEGWRVEAPAAEAFAIDLGRGDGVESRVFVLLDRREHPDGVVAAGCAGGPCDGETLETIVPRDFEGGSDPERVDTPVVARALLQACRRAADPGREIPPELAIALTLLARPVFGDPEALPVVPVDPTDVALGDPDLELAVDPAEDEDEALARIDALLREYLPPLAPDDPSDRRDTDLFVGNAMLGYKAHYSDGLLGGWPLEELTEFMLEFWPRKVTADHDAELGAPASISRFLGFLDARDSLSGASRQRLARAVSELLEPFVDGCAEPPTGDRPSPRSCAPPVPASTSTTTTRSRPTSMSTGHPPGRARPHQPTPGHTIGAARDARPQRTHGVATAGRPTTAPGRTSDRREGGSSRPPSARCRRLSSSAADGPPRSG